MTSATLWIEITMAGAIYLAAVCFLLAAGYRVDDPWATVKNCKEFAPYVSVFVVGASYILGILAHRTIQSLSYVVQRIPLRVLRALGVIRLVRNGSPLFEDLVVVWQSGSDRLHRELDFQFGLVALFRSMIFSIPTLWVSVSLWLIRTGQPHILGFSFVCALLWIANWAAHRRQWHQFNEIQEAAINDVWKNRPKT